MVYYDLHMNMKTYLENIQSGPAYQRLVLGKKPDSHGYLAQSFIMFVCKCMDNDQMKAD